MANSLQSYTQDYTAALGSGLDVDKLDISRRLSREIYEKKKKERAQYYAMVNKLLAVGIKGYSEWKQGNEYADLLNKEYKKRGLHTKAGYNLFTGKLTGLNYDDEGNLIKTEITGGKSGIQNNLLSIDDWQFNNPISDNTIPDEAPAKAIETYQNAVDDFELDYIYNTMSTDIM